MLIRKLALCTVFAAGLTVPAIGSADIVGTGAGAGNSGNSGNQASAQNSSGTWDWLLRALDIVGTGEPQAESSQAAPDIVGTGGE